MRLVKLETGLNDAKIHLENEFRGSRGRLAGQITARRCWLARNRNQNGGVWEQGQQSGWRGVMLAAGIANGLAAEF